MNVIRHSDLTWQDDALCREVDCGDLHFPEKGGSPWAAVRLCRRCEVQEECLSYALATDQQFGVWGGLTEPQRERLKKASREAEDVVEAKAS